MNNNSYTRWTGDEKKSLKEMVKNGDKQSDIAIALGRPLGAIEQQIARMGLTSRKNVPWPPKDERYLLDNWGKLTINELIRKLKRTKSAIYARIQIIRNKEVKR